MADITSTLQALNQRSQDPVFAGTVVGSNPTSVIDQALADQNTKYYQFPTDLPPHRFTIIQGKITGISTSTGVFGGGYNWQGGAVYALPLPTTIQDTKNIKYDHSFNWMKMIGTAASALGRFVGGNQGANLIGNLGGYAQVGAQIGQGLGYAVNNFKAVTIAVPEFRTFTLEFRLFPKTYQESVAIKQMANAIERGAHPPYGTALGIPVFAFPDIFMCMFSTGQSGSDGSKFLYKFKPAVINGISINYQGDAPVPAFYRSNDGQAIPESMVVRMNFIELEVWTRNNYDSSIGADGLNNSDPMSALHKGSIFGNGPV